MRSIFKKQEKRIFKRIEPENNFLLNVPFESLSDFDSYNVNNDNDYSTNNNGNKEEKLLSPIQEKKNNPFGSLSSMSSFNMDHSTHLNTKSKIKQNESNSTNNYLDQIKEDSEGEESYYSNDFSDEVYNLPIELFEENLNNFESKNKNITSIYYENNKKKSYIRKSFDVFLAFNFLLSLEFILFQNITNSINSVKLNLLNDPLFTYIYFSSACTFFIGSIIRNIYKYKEINKERNVHFRSLIPWNVLNINFFLTSLSMGIIGHSMYFLFLNTNINLSKKSYEILSIASKINLGIGLAFFVLFAFMILVLKKKDRRLFNEKKYLSNVFLSLSVSFFMYSILFEFGDKIQKGLIDINNYFNKIMLFNNYIYYTLIALSIFLCVALFVISVKSIFFNDDYYNNKYKNINKIKILLLCLYSVLSILFVHSIFSCHFNLNQNIILGFMIFSFGIFFNDLFNRILLYIDNKTCTFKIVPEKGKKLTNMICPVVFFSSLVCFSLSMNFYNNLPTDLKSINSKSLFLMVSGIVLISFGFLLKSLEIKNEKINSEKDMRIHSNLNINDNSYSNKSISFFKKNKLLEPPMDNTDSSSYLKLSMSKK
jgi:hypothetical protein